MAISNYPLSWPAGWERTPGHVRKNAQFGKVITDYRHNPNGWKQKKSLSITDGIARILSALGQMGVDRQDVIISTNVRTRLDGLPRAGEREPDDPGAAVYWQKEPGAPMRCMAIDRYSTVADNLAAVAATLDAMRAIERHGGAEILDRAFTGFKALPSQTAGGSWWQTLEVEPNATTDQIHHAFRQLARTAHPDVPGGSRERMSALNLARDQGIAAAVGRGGK